MKTLYLTSFCDAALKAMGKDSNSLRDEVNGDDLRTMASMLDIATARKRYVEFEESNKVTPAA